MLPSVFDSRSSDGDNNPTNDRFKKNDGYHAVPPPLTGNYVPPLTDLSFAGLNDSVYRPTANKASASISKDESSVIKTSNISVEMPKFDSVKTSGVIIEDWVSDDEDTLLGVFSAVKVLEDVAEQGRSVGNVQTYTRQRRRVNTAITLVSTASEMVNTGGLKARDKGKAVMQESEPTNKIKKRTQVQMSIDEELAQKLHEEELARFNFEQEAIDIEIKEKVVAEGDQAHDIDLSDPAVIRYHTLQNRPRSIAEDQIHSFMPVNSELEVQRSKRTVQEVERQSTEEEKGKKSNDSSKPTRKKTLARKKAGGNDSQESVKK
nr:hypothetical protein [Tanacetum cinerariifolium]